MKNLFYNFISVILIALCLVSTGCKKEEVLIPLDLSMEGTANCYVVSSAGAYKFPLTMGNSSESVGTVESAEVLWETFGTHSTPRVGEVIKGVRIENGYVIFQTSERFNSGNAVIAAKDASGTILWSWHIWLTDMPEGLEYYNGAGRMMDRNLGATSILPGDSRALGLLYQWGRKDPFLNSMSISSSSTVNSTLSWPSPRASESKTGTIAFAIANPTTFIYYNYRNYDWFYTGNDTTDNTRWTESNSTKSVYDPCPAGWRVPDAGVWAKAVGSDSSFGEDVFDADNCGIDLSEMVGDATFIWYPAAGYRHASGGDLYDLGRTGLYWSATPDGYRAGTFGFDSTGKVSLSESNLRATGQSVRCIQEN